MSTIIKARMVKVGRWLGWAGLVLAAWAAIMLAMPFIGSGRQVAVVGNEAKAIRAITQAGGQIVEQRKGATIAQGPHGFARALYRAGAPLVIEGRIAAGCFSPR